MKYLFLVLMVIMLVGCEDIPIETGENDGVVTDFESCVEAGNPVMESYPRQCKSGDETFTEEVEILKPCTREYMPVCGEVEVQCITEPCNPIKETFGNKCVAESYGATILYEGECVEEKQDIESICIDLGGNWVSDYNECEYINKTSCDELDGSFIECGSACRNDPEATICTMQCVPVCSLLEPKPIGGERDEHGCLGAAGYSWCESKQKCIRPWEEECVLEEEDECSSDSDCVTDGCSSTICRSKYSEGISTTCEYKEHYSCYKLTSCSCVAGKCGWEQTTEFNNCLVEKQ